MTSDRLIATDPLRRERRPRMNGNKQELLCPILSSADHIICRHEIRPEGELQTTGLSSSNEVVRVTIP